MNPTTEGPVAANPDRILTFGERAVGLTFNPSNDPRVYTCKSLFAQVIDQMDQLRSMTLDPEVKRMAALSITDAQVAQMWAVRALTFQ